MTGNCEIIYFEKYMRIALEESAAAFDEGEIPIGAAIVLNGELLARNHNRNRALIDPTAHAEILALREAARKLGVFRLIGADLFVTVEPCPMCAGAIIYSRIARVIYGCQDLKAGCDVSVCNILNNHKFNHRAQVIPNILSAECRQYLQDFFKTKRRAQAAGDSVSVDLEENTLNGINF